TPDAVVAQHGVDALRAYILFLGPFDAEVTWDDAGIKGVTRFLDRYWRLATRDWRLSPIHPITVSPHHAFGRERHKFIRRITGEMERFRFNTAVAAFMEYLNYLVEMADAAVPSDQWRQALETFTILLAPICPFIAEEVWQGVMGRAGSVHRQPWPDYDEALAADEVVTVVIQVNGKLRDRIEVSVDVDEAGLRETAVASPKVQRFINGQPIRKIIVVPPALVNIVI
ncbi:MAG: class I tRNA ligase family protein, partial [Chloroflexi bacterium]|nr:class I tRNA ligase family protein [Chloroflexota bacterium]